MAKSSKDIQLSELKDLISQLNMTIKTLNETIAAFCGARRTLMRFRADAMQSITDAPKRSILLFSSSAGLLLYSASSPA